VQGEVFRRSAQHVTEVTELARDQVGIFQVAHANRTVDAFFDQAAVAIAHRQFQPDIRVLHLEVREIGDQRSTAHRYVHRHPQLAARLDPGIAQRLHRLAKVGQDRLATLVERFAIVGEPQCAGRAEQKPHADLLFQPRYRPTDTRRGHAKLGGRGRKTFRFDDANEARYC